MQQTRKSLAALISMKLNALRHLSAFGGFGYNSDYWEPELLLRILYSSSSPGGESFKLRSVLAFVLLLP